MFRSRSPRGRVGVLRGLCVLLALSGCRQVTPFELEPEAGGASARASRGLGRLWGRDAVPESADVSADTPIDAASFTPEDAPPGESQAGPPAPDEATAPAPAEGLSLEAHAPAPPSPLDLRIVQSLMLGEPDAGGSEGAPASGEPAPKGPPVGEAPSPDPAAGDPAEKPVADAGDDQIGRVGHQLTLNGGRSSPNGALRYRWIQVGGPAVRLKLEDGYIYSFVPAEPGVYRFALVVADGVSISEPDMVEVVVRPESAPRPAAPSASAAPPPIAAAPTHATATRLDELTRDALARLPGGVETAALLADHFEDLALKMNLYASYGDVLRETAQRLESILPGDPAQRAAWDELLFQPLSQRLIAALLPAGLDLRTPQGQILILTEAQKSLLSAQFRTIASGARTLADASNQDVLEASLREDPPDAGD